MTIHADMVAATAPLADAEFELDVSIAESGPVVAALLQNTEDNCGQTCESACPATGC
ncbi:FxLD family lantipeptide [Haloactinospora alba]|uniref:FxLD family lantipeptide n=1 Tax=Haloactinospora alba TaxID=405555 RepID=A0A543N7M1_9ACTN|nr:FxLD family lanthipeptide [Haloactinospora alba]TQN27808.1 FxLD family lantipeptide [Haloactinospora alba]